ncbi:nitrilase-related carbon-nitrogen hydrolase, partial [Vibrio alginolyticus]
MTILQVSVAQINAQLGDVNANLNTHQDYIKQAAALGLQLLLFPELSLTGY